MYGNYSRNKSVQILIALMKHHAVKKVVVSPGTTNIEFVGSIQGDPFFEIYSSVDERSAAYIACGLAQKSGEPVALSCTGATASRNYLPGLTEAFYRQLPILAITSTQFEGRVGNYFPQVIDRSCVINDTCKLSVQIPEIHSDEEEWSVNTKINQALLELHHRGGGPVHINLQTTYNKYFDVSELPKTRYIDRITIDDKFPDLNKKKVAIFVGAHIEWRNSLTGLVDEFCKKYNGVVLCDHTSNYKGNYGIDATLICNQENYTADCRHFDILIHIGNVSGADMGTFPNEVWRVNLDGEVRDTFKRLRYVFEMSEEEFFTYYVTNSNICNRLAFFNEWKKESDNIDQLIPELPFSNAWIAQNTIQKLPENAVLYLGILNSLRTWDFFHLSKSITCYSNTGGFGIDGGISTALGMSLTNPITPVYCILGDLSFFYDMNAIGNRFLNNNLRILVVNNGKGAEFTNYNNPGSQFGKQTEEYIAAAGHYGNKSHRLIKHLAEDLGFKYFSASSKKEYLESVPEFLDVSSMEKPVIFEVFTDSQNESDALQIMRNLEKDYKGATKQMIKNMLGDKGVETVKKLLHK